VDKFSHNSFVISLAAFQSGKFIIAEDNLEKIYKKDNSDNTVIHLLALTKAALKKELEAASLFHILHQRNPKDLSILYNLATALMESGKYEESIQSFTKLSKFSINKPEIWLNFGKALSKLNKHKEAIAKYDEVLSIEPNNIHALYNKAVSYNQLTIYEEVQPILDKLLLIDKNNPFVHSLCGSLLFRKGLLEESLLAYQKANELNPNNALLWADIGVTLRSLNRLEESLISFKKALELEPDLDFLLGDYLHTKMRLCDWSDFDSDLQKCIDGIESAKAVIYPFPLLSLTDSPELELKCAQIYSQKHFQNIVAQPFLKPKIQPNGKIKVAYLSPDFRDHAVSQLIVEVLELHDKQHFEIYGFYFGPSTNDDMHHRIASTFNEFHSVAHLSDQAICDLIRSKEIDIAVDLAGHTQYNRAGILARRCAPIQINYLGYPGTMGASFIDYIIADSMVIPEDTYQYYSEKIINMPFTYQANSSRPALTEQSISRKDYGIDEDAFVFCCFNNSYKYNPHVFLSWLEILKSVKNGVLWLLSDNEISKENLKNFATQHGAKAEQLIFAYRLHYREHLLRYSFADLFLDTYPYGAHTTASESLKFGLPVLTCIGKSFSSGVAASLLYPLGLVNLITSNRSDYINKAIELAHSPDYLRDLRKILANSLSLSKIFNPNKFVRDLEVLYKKIYHDT
jgi:predicted O-linked N-acetylglucosamine transferase (SPINDLY family)